jgi:hypothetical protein
MSRRSFKIFKTMSDFIKTRDQNQCRSHHQKMEKEGLDIKDIIINVSSKYDPRIYKQYFERYEP